MASKIQSKYGYFILIFMSSFFQNKTKKKKKKKKRKKKKRKENKQTKLKRQMLAEDALQTGERHFKQVLCNVALNKWCI